MGLKCSPGYAQEVMENIFRNITDTEVFIDDIGAFSYSWDDHLKLLRIILTKLQENGFTVNPLTCEWAVTETDWLGYWLTPMDLNPGQNKLMQYLKCKLQPTLNYYVVLLEWLIITWICGHTDLTF
jgi:hypothetical protein